MYIDATVAPTVFLYDSTISTVFAEVKFLTYEIRYMQLLQAVPKVYELCHLLMTVNLFFL